MRLLAYVKLCWMVWLSKMNELGCICDFLNGVSVYSVQHLGWVSAVVAAILALTSIIFSQFNERVVQKINELTYELKKTKYKGNINPDLIKEDINQIIHLLANTEIYHKTLKLFNVVSYFIVFLWWISIFGYMDEAKTLADKVIIFLSTILLTIPFIYLPDILKLFNRNNSKLVLNKNGNLDFNTMNNYWRSLSIDNVDFITDILTPCVKLKLIDKEMHFNFSKDLSLQDFYVVISGYHNGKKIVIRYLERNDDFINTYGLENVNNQKKEINRGLFGEIKKLNARSFTMHILPLKSEDIFSYKGQIKVIEDEIVFVTISKSSDSLESALKEPENSLVFTKQGEDPFEYKLK